MGTQVKFEFDDRGPYHVAPTSLSMADARYMPEDHNYCIPCQGFSGCCARKDCGRVCYTTGCIVFTVNAILLIVLGVTILGPYNTAQTFKETNCTSASSEYTKDMKTCTYGKTQVKKYSCVVIFVNLTVNVDPDLEVDHADIPIDGSMVTGSGSVRSSHTQLYSDMFSLFDEEECSYVPRPCSTWGPTTFYYDHSQGKTFRCLYNPAKPLQVITERREDDLNLHILLPLNAIAVICFLMMIITHCQCGCDLVWDNCPQY